MRKPLRHLLILGCSSALSLSGIYGQSPDSKSKSVVEPTSAKTAATSGKDSGKIGFAAKASLLGGGIEVAARATHRTNVRAGFNILSYSRGFDKDGIDYHGHLSFKTFEAHYDIFPWAGSFHISPGLLAYLGDPVTAHALVPGNQSFTLGGATYYSDPSAPLTVRGKLNFNQVAPMATIGWGNLVHRDSKHFSVPFEIGVAFQGSPRSTLNLAGRVCDSPGGNCQSVASDPAVQSNVIFEQTKINKSMSAFKVYPIISVGFGYKF